MPHSCGAGQAISERFGGDLKGEAVAALVAPYNIYMSSCMSANIYIYTLTCMCIYIQMNIYVCIYVIVYATPSQDPPRLGV